MYNLSLNFYELRLVRLSVDEYITKNFSRYFSSEDLKSLNNKIDKCVKESNRK